MTPSRSLDLFVARDRTVIVTWVVLLAVAALLFVRLGDRVLWGDEAETATLAKNIVRHGLPRTHDGVNRITLFGAQVDTSAAGLWTWSPWLGPYVMAASFAVAGAGTLAARVPFALAAWLSVPLLGALLWRRYGDRQLAWMGMIHLGALELFILHGRQARYYALTVLAQVLLLWALHEIWERHARGRWLLVVAFLMHFYSNYILAVACGLALVGMALVSRRPDVRREIGIGLAVAAVGCLPWILYARIWAQSQMIGQDEERIASKLLVYTRELHFHVLPVILLAWPLWRWWRGTQPARRSGRDSRRARPAEPRGDAAPDADPLARGLLLLFPCLLLVLGVTPFVYLRYLLPLLPVAALLIAVSLRALPVRSWWQWGVLTVLISSNLVAWVTALPFDRTHRLRLSLVDVVDEISHAYVDRTRVVVDFFNRTVPATQTAFSFDPEFPLIFYTRLQIVDGRLTGGRLPDPAPDWILAQSASTLDTVELPPAVAAHYERVLLTTPRFRPLASMPEPDVREYRTAAASENFVLYRRRPP